MRRPALVLGALLAAVTWLAAALPHPSLAADPSSYLRPEGLHVAGGSAAWQPDNDFQLDWDLHFDGLHPPTAVHRQIRDPAGNALGPVVTEPWHGNRISNLRVPAGPGRYEVEVWLEDGSGTGPHESVELRFDDAPPATPAADTPGPWQSGRAGAILFVGSPAGSPPVSGIRGYAISVDRSPQGSPCAAGRCSEGETDLRVPGGGTASLGVLPEGRSFAHVATVSGSGVSSAVRDVEVRVDATPPAVALSGIPSGWSDGPVRVVASASDPLSGMEPAGPAGPLTEVAVDAGPATASAGSSVGTVVSGDGVHLVEARARDAVGNVGAGGPASAFVRIDTGPPAVSFAAAQDPQEPERIEAAVADPLSGPAADRGSISFRRAGTHGAFQSIPTAASPGRLVADWDSEAFPPGTYEFKATGYDAAGNAASTDRRGNGARMVLINPLKAEAVLRFGFGGRRLPAERTVRFGRRVPVGGTLTTASGAPLPGHRIELVESFGPGAKVGERTTAVTTKADGSFTARLAPGPGRRIEARFAGSATLNHASGPGLTLRVPSSIRLRASAATARVGGPPVLFRGRLARAGATIPAAGLPIELQFRVGGSGWNEFRTVQTDRAGRFRLPYAFSDDDSRGVRFQFRAAVPPQDDWPYEPAASRPVAVTGR